MLEISRSPGQFTGLTTEAVLAEFLNLSANSRPAIRQESVRFVREIQSSWDVEIVPRSYQSFRAGVGYARQGDKV